MKVYVKASNEQQISVNLAGNSTIGDLRRIIKAEWTGSLAIGKFKLLYNGRFLREDRETCELAGLEVSSAH